MRHGAVDLADLEEADLTEVHVGEGVADEGIKAGLVDLHVEDGGASGGDEDRLNAVLRRVRDVGVDPGPVEDRSDDVEVGVEGRTGLMTTGGAVDVGSDRRRPRRTAWSRPAWPSADA